MLYIYIYKHQLTKPISYFAADYPPNEIGPDNAEGAPRTPTTQRSRRNGSSLNLSPTETALLRRVPFEQQRGDGGGGE
jgi:hypothetical protein